MTTKEFQERSDLRIFLSYFKPHKKLFVLDMVCALTIALIDLAFPYLSRWCMYELLPQNAYRTFFTVMAVAAAAFAVRGVLTYIIGYYGHTFGILVEADIRRDLFRHMQELDFGYYDRNRTGALMSRLTSELFEITELAHHGPEDIFISGVTVIGALVIMFTIQWRLALVLTIMIPVFLLVVWSRRRAMRDASRQVKRTIASINADFESGVSGMKTAKAFANEQMELEKFDRANHSFRNSKYRFHSAMGLFNAVLEFFLCILSAAVIAVGGALIMKGELTVIDLVAFNLYGQPPLDRIHDNQGADNGKSGNEDVLRSVVRQLGDVKEVAGQAAHQLSGAVPVIKIISQLLHMPEQVTPDIGFDPYAEAVPPVCNDIGEYRTQHICHRHQRHHRPKGFPVVIRDQGVKAPAGHKGKGKVDDSDHQSR